MEEIGIMTWDMGHEINDGDDDGNPTQVDALGGHGGPALASLERSESELVEEIDLAAASDTNVSDCGLEGRVVQIW